MVSLRTSTPVMGGGAVAQRIDGDEPIRVPSLRGQLRWWWRALHATDFRTAELLHEREQEIWGGVALDAKRSPIEITVRVLRKPSPDRRPFDPRNMRDAYAVWPTREQRAPGVQGEPSGWLPGLEWELRILAPPAAVEQANRALRAWILFGGYGSRTRRGMGSLTVLTVPDTWLPADVTSDELSRILGVSLIDSSTPPNDTPSLRGAALLAGAPGGALDTWYVALGWLRDFRQKDGPSSDDAREAARPSHGGGGQRPGRSRWPEPDKIRHRVGLWTRAPRYNSQWVWPRASFGLPIIGRFPDEPARDFELSWHRGPDTFNRLASPLIVKPLALADGRFVPIALWLNRAFPRGGTVFLKRAAGDAAGPSDAPFDQLAVAGDTASHAPLTGASSMRDAFFEWVLGKPGVHRVL